MKKWITIIILLVVVLALAWIFQKTGLFKTMSSEELQNSIEILDVETKWVDKYYQPWPPRLVIVPTISFRVKNISDKAINYINFNANFRFKDDYENLGDAFLAAIREDPIPPGETSEVIFLKSNYGVDGKSLDQIKTNPHWKTVIVKLFAQSKGSQYITLGEWDVSREIDFKEPEPVGPETEKKPEEVKKEEKK